MPPGKAKKPKRCSKTSPQRALALCAKKEIAGVIRYCVYREIGYFVGFQFDAVSRWSKTKYRPRHRLDLEKLLRASASDPKPSKHPVACD
jgi:hypothetical protein